MQLEVDHVVLEALLLRLREKPAIGVIPGGNGGEQADPPPAEGGPQNGGASNMWVLSGARTESGKPLLAGVPA